MPPPKRRPGPMPKTNITANNTTKMNLTSLAKSAWSGALDLATVPSRFNLMLMSGILLVMESIACMIVVWKVPYTEIDWVAYMQEVRN